MVVRGEREVLSFVTGPGPGRVAKQSAWWLHGRLLAVTCNTSREAQGLLPFLSSQLDYELLEAEVVCLLFTVVSPAPT